MNHQVSMSQWTKLIYEVSTEELFMNFRSFVAFSFTNERTSEQANMFARMGSYTIRVVACCSVLAKFQMSKYVENGCSNRWNKPRVDFLWKPTTPRNERKYERTIVCIFSVRAHLWPSKWAERIRFFMNWTINLTFIQKRVQIYQLSKIVERKLFLKPHSCIFFIWPEQVNGLLMVFIFWSEVQMMLSISDPISNYISLLL